MLIVIECIDLATYCSLFEQYEDSLFLPFVLDVLFIPLFYCDFLKRYCGQAKCDEFAGWENEGELFILLFLL